MDHTVEILHTGFVTHDVKQFVTSRPEGLEYRPGQGVEIALDLEGWRKEGRPFTPTGATDGPVLEFTIKAYPERDGVTDRLHALEPGAKLLMSDAFGTITDRGPGTFIAGGAGVTPFLAILRQRARDDALDGCSLLFSNKTTRDVICEKELLDLLQDRCHLSCSRASVPGYDGGRIDRAYLEDKIERLDSPLYVCGPPDFVDGIRGALVELGADEDTIVVEE